MSSSSSNTEYSVDSEVSDVESIPEYDEFDEYDIEVEDEFAEFASHGEAHSLSQESRDSFEMAYAEEPLADEEWLKQYEKEVKETEDLKLKLQRRLDGDEGVDSW